MIDEKTQQKVEQAMPEKIEGHRDVFISYSRKEYVDEDDNVMPGYAVSIIKNALTDVGITNWFDEEGIYSGDKFTEKMSPVLRYRSLLCLYLPLMQVSHPGPVKK